MRKTKRTIAIRQNIFGFSGIEGALELLEDEELSSAIKRRGLKPKENKRSMVNQLMSHIVNRKAKCFFVIQ
jgi:hypothetical protein